MRFSVVIPVHDATPFLSDCLDSLLGQTHSDWEAVCVDDGSTDGSGRILDEYAARDVRFRVVHQANGGEGAARNAGLDLVRGEWVYFLDADDLLGRRTLEICAEGARFCPAADLVTVVGRPFGEREVLRWTESGQGPSFRTEDLRNQVGGEIYRTPVWACAIRAELIGDLRFGALKIGADRVFMTALLGKAHFAAVSDYVGYGYRQRAASESHARHSTEKFLHHVRCHASVAALIAASPKRPAPETIRALRLMMTEYLADDYRRLSPEARKQVWAEWSAALRTVGDMTFGGMRMGVSVRLVGQTGSRLLMMLLFWVPYWLKLHGVNRRLAVHRAA